jgi:threonine dehydratase
MITLTEIQSAQRVIANKLHRTPLLHSSTLSRLTGTELHLKAEVFQKTGSFKPRGVFNKVSHLSQEGQRRGLIAVSAGNHAQAVAYVAQIEKIPAIVVMPAKAVPSKLEATRQYGAEVVLHGKVTEIFAKAEEIGKARNLSFVHPFDDPLVIAGQGTVGLEILEDFPAVEAVVVGIGGGGLISGVAAAIKLQKPTVKIIGVEPLGAAAMHRSLQTGRPVRLEKIETIADGLAAPFAGEKTFQLVQRYVDDLVLVSDDEIRQAIGLLMERCKLIVEPAGAASVAALLADKVKLPEWTKTVCVLSGGNIDLNEIQTLIGR